MFRCGRPKANDDDDYEIEWLYPQQYMIFHIIKIEIYNSFDTVTFEIIFDP